LSWTCMNIKDVHLQQQLEGRAWILDVHGH
jgi:hypothetical protein